MEKKQSKDYGYILVIRREVYCKEVYAQYYAHISASFARHEAMIALKERAKAVDDIRYAELTILNGERAIEATEAIYEI